MLFCFAFFSVVCWFEYSVLMRTLFEVQQLLGCLDSFVHLVLAWAVEAPEYCHETD